MAHRHQVSIVQCVQRQLALRAINLALFIAEVRQLAPGQRRISGFQTALISLPSTRIRA
jgi:hypothetical protein